MRGVNDYGSVIIFLELKTDLLMIVRSTKQSKRRLTCVLNFMSNVLTIWEKHKDSSVVRHPLVNSQVILKATTENDNRT